MAEILGPDERREIDRLGRALGLGTGPAFHLVVGDTRRVVDMALAAVLPGLEPHHETVAPEEAPKAFAVRWMKWIEAAIHEGGKEPLALDAWDVDPEHVEHWGWIFARLNERRNEIMRGLGRPWLLLASPQTEQLLGRTAPDLWSIRGVGMRLRDRGRATVDRSLFERARPARYDLPDAEELAAQQRRASLARNREPSLAHAIEVLRLSQRLHEAKRDGEAMTAADEAVGHYEALAREDDGTLIDLARALRTRARIAAGLKRRQAALDDLQRAELVLTAMERQEPGRVDLLRDLQTNYETLGDLNLGEGQQDVARQLYAQADAIEARRKTLESRDPEATRSHVPSLFVSYGHADSEAHVAQVLALADRLRGDGIDARIDRYVVSPIEGWFAWTLRQVAEVDFVVFICTDDYRRRFEDDTSDALDAALARHLLYETSVRTQGLLPVLLPGSAARAIPLALRAYTAYSIPDDYDRMVRRIRSLR